MQSIADYLRYPLKTIDEIALTKGYLFDFDEAKKIEDFTKYMHINHNGETKPIELMDWQRFVILSLLCWKKDNRNRFDRGYVSTGKKNGKTNLLAVLGILYIYLYGVDVFAYATAREQAGEIYEIAANIIESSPELKATSSIREYHKQIKFRGKRFAAKAAKAGPSEGVNSIVFYDEIHAAENRKLFDSLRYAGKALSNPLFLMTTTAGDTESVLCREEYDLACRVRDGEAKLLNYFAAIWETTAADDIHDPATWEKANPAIGKLLRADDFRNDLEAALASPSEMATFLRRRLNQWTSASTRWIEADTWDQCTTDQPLNPDDYKGLPCWLGVDLAPVGIDLNSIVAVFKIENKYHCLNWNFLPAEGIEKKEKAEAMPYRAIAEQSQDWLHSPLELMEGDVTDFNLIESRIKHLCDYFDVQSVSIDKRDGWQLMGNLEKSGIEVIPYEQGFRYMSPPSKELERLLKSKEIIVGNNPILNNHAINVEIKSNEWQDIRPVKPGKSKSGKAHIDSIVALIMALGRAMITEEKTSERDNYYSSGGKLLIV